MGSLAERIHWKTWWSFNIRMSLDNWVMIARKIQIISFARGTRMHASDSNGAAMHERNTSSCTFCASTYTRTYVYDARAREAQQEKQFVKMAAGTCPGARMRAFSRVVQTGQCGSVRTKWRNGEGKLLVQIASRGTFFPNLFARRPERISRLTFRRPTGERKDESRCAPTSTIETYRDSQLSVASEPHSKIDGETCEDRERLGRLKFPYLVLHVRQVLHEEKFDNRADDPGEMTFHLLVLRIFASARPSIDFVSYEFLYCAFLFALYRAAISTDRLFCFTFSSAFRCNKNGA